MVVGTVYGPVPTKPFTTSRIQNSSLPLMDTCEFAYSMLKSNPIVAIRNLLEVLPPTVLLGRITIQSFGYVVELVDGEVTSVRSEESVYIPSVLLAAPN